MFTTILGGLALLAIIAAVVFLTPAEPWRLDGETWYEQFSPRTGRDSFAEELAVMRMELEAEAIAAARPSRPIRPVVASLDVAPGASQLSAPNRSW